MTQVEHVPGRGAVRSFSQIICATWEYEEKRNVLKRPRTCWKITRRYNGGHKSRYFCNFTTTPWGVYVGLLEGEARVRALWLIRLTYTLSCCANTLTRDGRCRWRAIIKTALRQRQLYFRLPTFIHVVSRWFFFRRTAKRAPLLIKPFIILEAMSRASVLMAIHSSCVWLNYIKTYLHRNAETNM